MSSVDIPKEITKSLHDAIEAYETCRGILYDVWNRYDLPNDERWIPWSVANELRYVGQHVCRLLKHKVNSDDWLKELARAKSHCERAGNDAHDYIILYFTRNILDRITSMEKSADIPGNIQAGNIAKKEFCEICDLLAENDRKNLA